MLGGTERAVGNGRRLEALCEAAREERDELAAYIATWHVTNPNSIGLQAAVLANP